MKSTFIKSANLKELNRDTDEWKSHSNYISKSGLVRIKKSPDHFKNGEPYIDTPEKIFGRRCHCFLFQEEKFRDIYYIFDDSEIYDELLTKGFEKPRATKEYKSWYVNQEVSITEKEIIDKDDFDKMTGMKEKLLSHLYTRMLLKNGIGEQGIIGELETNAGEIGIKLIPDYRKDIKHLIVEYKTTRDASKKGFERDCAEYDYHIQAAFYKDIVELLFNDEREITFIFIVQEKYKPYAFNIFEASNQFIAQGRYEYEMLLQLYKYCLDNNYWPGYQCWCHNKYGILELKLPAWAIKSLDYFIYKS